MSALLAALRIARRDALRHKARSALIVTMIALPVLGVSAADVLARTMQLSAGEHVTREIGQADVALAYVGGRVTQSPDPVQGYVNPGAPSAVGPQSGPVGRALAIVGARPGTTTLVKTSTTVRANGLQAGADLTKTDLDIPLTHGIATLLRGHAPSTASQVAVTPHLLHRLGLSIGSTVTIDVPAATRPTVQTRTITGVVSNPSELRQDGVYEAATASRVDSPTVLAATRRPVTWSQVRALNALGFLVTSRYVVEHPPVSPVRTYSFSTLNAARVGVATVSVGLAVLEVVLLAGAAFAVGARRQRRDLAVVSAAGGDAADVATIVLAGGVILGLVGAVTGVLAGVGVARLALGEAARLADHSPGHFDIRPLELLGVLGLGLLTGIVASVLPARTAARDDVVSALTGRRGTLTSSRRVPVLGLAMTVGGTLLAGVAATEYHFKLILTGAVVSELGFVFCASPVVALVGRLARFLPLAPRLALRDAARHRGRSGPAVAAVMAAIAGSVAVSAFFVSTVDRDRRDFVPQARIGQSVVDVNGASADTTTTVTQAMAVMRRDLGDTTVIEVPAVGCVKVTRHCDNLMEETASGQGAIAVGDQGLLRVLSGSDSAAATAALAAGKIVLFVAAPNVSLLGSGSLITQESASGRSSSALAGARVYLDATGRQGTSISGIMTPATAARLHLVAGPFIGRILLGTGNGVPSQSQEDRANNELDSNVQLTVGRPYSAGGYAVGLIALAMAAAIVTLGATAVSVGLSMAESQPDLVTLTAVGGRPLTRRLLVANQAGTVSVLGAVLGVVAGLIPAWAILRADHSVPFVMPWATILVLVIGLPGLAMAGAAAVAGARLTLNRRLT